MNDTIEKLFGKQIKFYKNRDLNLDEHDVFFIDGNRAEFFKIRIPELQIVIPKLMKCYQFQRFDEKLCRFPIMKGSRETYIKT